MPEKEIRFYRATGPYGFLSNLYPARLIFQGREFRCAEEAYQFGKPKDPRVAEWLVAAPHPHLVAVAAHALLAFDIKPHWNDVKVSRMRAVLRAKFTQDTLIEGKPLEYVNLGKALLATGMVTLIEDSKTDAFWGIGKNGKGQNTLGKLLMDLREDLRS